mmetsp:Transcript_39428/g.64056  ORF Transcript_39428/g.64056 Transcript_39428/m.64056 type:complete len:99 (+) Transcript_39428:1095-1391(+)
MAWQLPLKLHQVLWVRPHTGRAAITIACSRPVISIGSHDAGSAEHTDTHLNDLNPLHWRCMPDIHTCPPTLRCQESHDGSQAPPQGAPTLCCPRVHTP